MVIWTRIAPLGARPISSGASHNGSVGYAVARVLHSHLQATDCSPLDRWQAELLERGPCRVASRFDERGVDHGRRHRARHKGKDGFCTQIGNANFTRLGTTSSKSRFNFLELLRAGRRDYVVNKEALAYMRARALTGSVIARLRKHKKRTFASRRAWIAHPHQIGAKALRSIPIPCRSPPKALCGALSRRTVCSPTP